jgi:hypothetical protein
VTGLPTNGEAFYVRVWLYFNGASQSKDYTVKKITRIAARDIARLSEAGVRFTAVGVITPDPASVESVLAWASRLQERVEYVVVENAAGALSDFTYWRSTKQAIQFREAFAPTILQMEFRLAELENPIRQHGVALGQVAERKTAIDKLKRASLVMRAQSYRRRLFIQFDQAREAFLP